jgi:hypothetical protein
VKKMLAPLVIALLLPLGLSAADAKDAKKSCCAKGEKSVAGKDAKDAKCEHEKAAAKIASSCQADAKSDVILVGKLLCEHCNLHRSETCSPVFKAEGRDGEIPVCAETKDLEKIKTMGEHGKVTLEVKGTLCKAKDGKEQLMIATFSKKA